MSCDVSVRGAPASPANNGFQPCPVLAVAVNGKLLLATI